MRAARPSPSEPLGPALARLLALYLALLLVLQAVAAAQALARGPLHRHDVDAAPTPALAGAHAHADGQRHLHTAGEAGVQPLPDADPALDDAAFALTAALALLAFAASRTGPATGRHVLNAAPGLHPNGRTAAPPDRPPRFR